MSRDSVQSRAHAFVRENERALQPANMISLVNGMAEFARQEVVRAAARPYFKPIPPDVGATIAGTVGPPRAEDAIVGALEGIENAIRDLAGEMGGSDES